MAITQVSEWSTTAANNTELNGISIGNNALLVTLVDNVVRELMTQIAVYRAAIPAKDDGTLEVTGGASIDEIRRGQGTINFSTIASGQVKRSTLTVTGVANNAEWLILALGQNGTKPLGVSFEAFITASNEVTVQAINHSAIEVTDVTRTFTVLAVKAS